MKEMGAKTGRTMVAALFIVCAVNAVRAETYASTSDVYSGFNWDTVELQVRSCSDASCSGIPFQGPDNTTGTWFQQPLTYPADALTYTNLSENQYFQYRALLWTYDNRTTPRLSNVSVGYDRIVRPSVLSSVRLIGVRIIG